MSTGDWTFLSNHGHLFVAVARDPDARVRDLAQRVGITERAVQLILNDLVDAGYLSRARQGRRNHYEIAAGQPFRHPVESGHTVDELLRLST